MTVLRCDFGFGDVVPDPKSDHSYFDPDPKFKSIRNPNTIDGYYDPWEQNYLIYKNVVESEKVNSE